MKKFTIFTIILTIVIVVVLAELMTGGSVATDQGSDGDMKLTLPSSLDINKSIATNTLGADGGDLTNKLGADNTVLPTDDDEENLSPIAIDTTANPEFLDPDSFEDPTTQSPTASKQTDTQVTDTSGLRDFEDEAPLATFSTSANVYLRDEQIKSAGFTGGYLESEPLDGRLFKTIDISDLVDVEATKTNIRSELEILAKVYVFKVGIANSASEVYQTLKLKASQGLNITLNETNEFGSASFFMNDPVRSDTAFLTVRIAGLVYSFSYPKNYHSQIKNLIQLIAWELG